MHPAWSATLRRIRSAAGVDDKVVSLGSKCETGMRSDQVHLLVRAPSDWRRVCNRHLREGSQMAIEKMFDLRGRVALVTGAAGSLGSAIATVYADAGADLMLVDVDVDELQRRAKELQLPAGRQTDAGSGEGQHHQHLPPLRASRPMAAVTCPTARRWPPSRT